MPASRMPVVIDVDTGIDDALGLLYACAQSQIEILGVSTVAGNVDLEMATRNTRAVLILAGQSATPVWPGAAGPLLREAEDARAVHGQFGLGDASLPEPPPTAPASHAVDQIIAAARAHKGALVLVATGPLTNIAAAIGREPALPRMLKRLVLMGGAYAESGNVTATAEFNIWHDPEAARIVFRAFGAPGAAPLVAIGLDVTRRTRLLPGHLEELARRCAGAPGAPTLLRFLEDATRHYFDFIEKREGARFFIMHDPLAIAASIDPSLVDTTPVAVDVETGGRLTAGMTVADWRGVWRRPPNARVARAVDDQRMIAGFLDAMERLARQSRSPSA